MLNILTSNIKSIVYEIYRHLNKQRYFLSCIILSSKLYTSNYNLKTIRSILDISILTYFMQL